MDGWMDGWVDGWKDGWMDGWMDGWGICKTSTGCVRMADDKMRNKNVLTRKIKKINRKVVVGKVIVSERVLREVVC